MGSHSLLLDPSLCYPLCRYERPVSLYLIVNNILCLFDEYLKIADLSRKRGWACWGVECNHNTVWFFCLLYHHHIVVVAINSLTDYVIGCDISRLLDKVDPLVVDIVMLRHRNNKLFCFSLVALAWCCSFFTFTDIDWAVKQLIISRIFIQQAQCRHFKLSMTTFQKRTDVFNKNLNHFRSLSEMCPSIAAKWPPGMNWTFWFPFDFSW